MKVEKEFKDEVDQTTACASYAARKIGSRVIVWIIVVAAIFGAVGIGGRYLKTNADRKIFKQSVTYNEGMLDDLAKYKYEYDKAEDDVEREAIAALVRGRFANYDRNKIENVELLRFLEECN